MPRASLSACVLLLCAVTAGAQEPPAPPTPEAVTPTESKAPVEAREFLPENVEPDEAHKRARQTAKSAPAMVVSGGISLGAYQAGFVATLVRFWSVARREGGGDARLGDPTPRVWTGASAGAVNALLGGLASCDPAFTQPRWSPEESLFWTVWIQRLDLDKLLPVEDPHRTDHLFSDPYMKETIELIQTEAAKTRFQSPCSFGFGLTVTNLRGRDVPFGLDDPDSPALLKRVTEKLVVQVMTNEQGQLLARLPFREGAKDVVPPYIEVEDNEFRYYPALGERPTGWGGQNVPIQNVLGMPRASGAFPFAFPPVELPVSFFDKTSWGQVEPLNLVDGGFLNNNPVDLAERLGRRWRETGRGTTNFNSRRFPIVYLDQDVVGWKWKEPDAPGEGSLSPLEKTYFQYAGNLVSGAQNGVVLNSLEHDPALSGRIKIPRRSTVLLSEYRFAMMGFFDQRFREHDFYRGMQDAIRFLATQFTSTLSVGFMVPHALGDPRQSREQQIRDVLGISSEGFQCVVDGVCPALSTSSGSPSSSQVSPRERCQDKNLPESQAVRQDELRRLREVTDGLTTIAKNGALERDAIDELLGALGKAGYHYSCNGVMEGAEATGTREDLRRVRKRVGRAFHDMVSNQKEGLRIALRPAGAAFLDEWLTYTQPHHAFTFNVSRQRGVGLGVEAPLIAREEGRTGKVYNRGDLRLGLALSGFGVRDMDQLIPNKTRVRWVSLGGYLDWVSDLDGFYGNVPFLNLGPFVRWRAGLGISGSYLSAPNELALHVPEARFGLDLMELLGVRLSVPLYAFRMREGEPTLKGSPKFFKEIAVGGEVLFTWW